MGFYSPLKKGPDIMGGLTDYFQQFLMMKLLKQMYPKKKEKREKVPTELPPPRMGTQFDIGSQIQSMALGPGQMQQGQPLDINQILQMLQMLGMKPGV